MEELRECPFCGEYLVRTQDSYTNKYGKECKEDYYSHDVEKNPGYCLIEEICVGNNLKDITAWNTRPDNWISVEERLPETNEDVLVVVDYGGKSGVITGYMRSQNLGWQGLVGQRLTDVTYWMPLPEPPKGRGN